MSEQVLMRHSHAFRIDAVSSDAIHDRSLENVRLSSLQLRLQCRPKSFNNPPHILDVVIAPANAMCSMLQENDCRSLARTTTYLTLIEPLAVANTTQFAPVN